MTSSDFPSRIQIQTINLCNYGCDMCPYPDLADGRIKQLLPDAVFDDLLAQCEAKGRTVDLCLMLQNEPLLDPRFPELVQRAHRSPSVRTVATVTNGSKLTEELLDALVELPRFEMTVSVNATNRGEYRQVHRRDRWDRMHALLAGWSGPRHRVLLSAVMDADFPERGRRFRELWEPLGYRTRLVPMNQRNGSKPLGRALHVLRSNVGHCRYPVDTLSVLATGSVILCCQDWRHDETFGNVQGHSIEEIWNSAPLRRVRTASVCGRLRTVAQCRSCDYPMRSGDRYALERTLQGDPLAATPHVVHRARLSGADGGADIDANVAVTESLPDGTVGVVGVGLPPGSLSLHLPLSYENGSVMEVPCRVAASAPGVQIGRGLRRYSLELDRDDRNFVYYGWYRQDWSSTNGEVSHARAVEDGRR